MTETSMESKHDRVVGKVGRPEMIRLGIAMLGGILVLNAYLSGLFFSESIDSGARSVSAFLGAGILSLPIFFEALRDLIKGKVHMNELVALALVASFANENYLTAGTVAFFMLITITIEKRTAIGAEAAIEAVVRLTPRIARRVVGDREEEVDAFTDLKIGDVCRVRPGENFPADGIITQGRSTVNQASITGESLPVDKEVGNEAYAGTQNLTGLVEFRVTRIGADTTLGKVRNLIADAERSKLPIMRMIDKYVGYYTPTILMIAGLVWFITMDMTRVIAVLVMAVPAAFVLATPTAVIAAIAAASRLGILIKDVSYIEQAAKIGAIIFDKTGTLTEGELAVACLEPCEDVELATLLETATCAEHHSNHPAAEAMRRLAKQANVQWQAPDSYEEVPGRGVRASFGGRVSLVGRESWLASEGVDTSSLTESLQAGEQRGLSAVCVALDGKALGWIGLSDEIRPVSQEAVAQLKELGVDRCCMVTGDNERVARAVAAQIGITEIKSGCLPEEKEEYVRKLKEEGKVVAVVGDGVNDAPALAAGDIGIAMGAFGSDIAVQSAAVALMNNDLRRIPFFIGLSRQTRVLTLQNFTIGLGFIVVGVYLATVGGITPVGAALLHSVSSLMVIFNSARLVRSGEMLQASGEDGAKE